MLLLVGAFRSSKLLRIQMKETSRSGSRIPLSIPDLAPRRFFDLSSQNQKAEKIRN